MKLVTPSGQTVTRWEDWTRPKHEYQWKAGRSAMELAKAWFCEGSLKPPMELLSLLAANPRLASDETDHHVWNGLKAKLRSRSPHTFQKHSCMPMEMDQ